MVCVYVLYNEFSFRFNVKTEQMYKYMWRGKSCKSTLILIYRGGGWNEKENTRFALATTEIPVYYAITEDTLMTLFWKRITMRASFCTSCR